MGGVLQLHQQAKVKAGGTAADADNIHGVLQEDGVAWTSRAGRVFLS
jgi:hypothetical protein